MKKENFFAALLVLVFYTILALVLLFVKLASGGDDVPDSNNPKQVFEEVWEKYRGKETIYEKEEMWMVIVDDVQETPRKRNLEEVKNLTQKRWGVKMMTRYLKYDTGLLDKVYINFTFPPRDDKTQFLIWRYPNKYDDMWMYSPVLVGDRKIRRIPTSAQHEDYFMGSTLTHEDIRRLMGEVGGKAEPFHFNLMPSDGGITVISVRPKVGTWVGADADTGYSERRFFIPRDKSYFTVVKYYKNGQLAKIQKNSYISYQNGLWRPLLVEMYDVQNKSSTILYFSERKFFLEKEIPKGIFEINYMMRHGR